MRYYIKLVDSCTGRSLKKTRVELQGGGGLPDHLQHWVLVAVSVDLAHVGRYKLFSCSREQRRAKGRAELTVKRLGSLHKCMYMLK